MINYLIFDGNYILHKCVQALKNTDRFYSGLYRLMELTMEKYIKLNSWDKIIFVSDTRKKSWRTNYIDNYKGTRVRDDSIDWDFVYETYIDFKKDIADKYFFLEEDHIEGDDWILFCSRYANKMGMGSCVISSDGDLYQMVKYDLKKGYMNIQIADKYNAEKVIIPEGWELLYDQVCNSEELNDVFNLSNTSSNIDFFDHCRTHFEIKEVNNTNIIFEKLLTGDKGDNVMSAHKVLTSKGDKYMGIGVKTAEKTWNHYTSIYDTFNTNNDSDIYNMIESYETVKKKDFNQETKDSIYNNIQHNIKMMQLLPRVYPEDIKYIITEKILDAFETETK